LLTAVSFFSFFIPLLSLFTSPNSPFRLACKPKKPTASPPVMPAQQQPPRVEVKDLSYTFPDYSTGVRNISLDLPPRSRTLLIGANGAGKTTLLRLLAGKRLAPSDTISICGVDPFKQGLEGVTYLGLEWVLNPIVRNDIGVMDLLRSVGGDAYPERRDELVLMLDIDMGWRMHAVSDGERRRVQLAMGLIRPWTVLFLDEITVDLDVLSRAEFLGWPSGRRSRASVPLSMPRTFSTTLLAGPRTSSTCTWAPSRSATRQTTCWPPWMALLAPRATAAWVSLCLAGSRLT